MLAAKARFGMIENVSVNFWPEIGGRNSDVSFERSVVTSKLVVVGFTKCHFSVFLWQVKSRSWIFVIVQSHPHQFVVVLEQFWC